MELPLEILVLKAKRAAYDLIASSILEIKPVTDWIYEDKHYELPVVIKGATMATLRTRIEVPMNESMNESMQSWVLKIITNGNALLRIDGNDYAGIDDYHTYYPVEPGEHKVELLLDNTRLFGDHEPYLILYNSYLARIDNNLFKAGIKALGILDLAEKLGEQEKRSIIDRLYKIIEAGQTPNHIQMAAALITLWIGSPYVFNKRVDIPEPVLDHFLAAGLYGSEILAGEHHVFEPDPAVRERANQINEELDKLLSSILADKLEHTIHVAGHSHLDAAWLWDYLETRRKIRRTFSTAAMFAEKNDMRFIQSSSLYLDWLEQESPELYQRVKELVRKGSWIPVGGMLVEPDLWMVDGESLARLLVLGQREFIERLGRPSRIGWLPDSFGYPSSLPQLLVKAGIELLVIHKNTWNIINKPVHHAFIWRGVDGTEIPVYTIPTNYAEALTPSHILEYDRKAKAPREIPIIMSYGYSDGGGGPSWEMMIYREQLLGATNKVKDIDEEELVEAYRKAKDKLPVITGDLLLEIHKGTLTTNHRIKDCFARAEMTVRSAEISEALTAGRALDEMWRKLLLHAFHDVLPGTSVPRTYEYALREIEGLLDTASGIIRRNVVSGSEGYTIYNDLPWHRSGIVLLRDHCIGGDKIEYCVPIGWGEYAVKIKKVPGIGASWSKPGEVNETGNTYVDLGEIIRLGNESLELTVSDTGEILRLRDKSGINYLNEPSNLLLVHLDRPPVFDAWELDPSGLMNGQPLEPNGKPQILAGGGGAACIEFSKKTGRSKVRMRVCLFSGVDTVRVDLDLDWRDRLRYLKAWFEPDIWADKAWFEIPFGAVARPTMPEDPRKYALLYEVPALRWMDINDGEKGLAVISMHKHGYSVLGGKIGLTIHKAPTIPDPYSGIGRFRVTYYLYPHKGDTWRAMVPAITYELWSPLKIFRGQPLIGERIISIEPEKLAIITGLRGSGNIVYANIYNPYPIEREVEITGKYRVVGETDLIGKNRGETENPVRLRGFEVKTIMLERI